ncbi:hypothetical protein HWV62_40000 [Athelia sp. TMB]|nr:hypothetical protein HWV62_40000 [Athelia sp. TMB]
MSHDICAPVSRRHSPHARMERSTGPRRAPSRSHLLTNTPLTPPTDTGDRPYKCQFCGDQFARRCVCVSPHPRSDVLLILGSDLLARHVNKCHAHEKPTGPAAANARRKGTAGASRATTSKQACDQCVQSSLPCDGCNPCAKCVSRKCRCTYVKFHRQTAPAGPGHTRPAAPPSLTQALPRADDFLLPSYAPAFSFPYAGGSDPQLAGDGGGDFAAKYRAQAELLRRAGAGAGGGGGYAEPWYGVQGWQDGSPQMSSSAPNQSYLHEQLGARYSNGNGGGEYDNGGGLFYAHRPRRDSIDFGGSDTSSSHGHELEHERSSVPSSAASSSLHLPLADQMYHHIDHDPHFRPADDQFQRARDDQFQPTARHESGFSSAFGLMSIDDPAVLHGLAADGAPFFSSAAMQMPPGDPNATPMPPKGAGARGLVTPGLRREEETRELREFWKQYINQTPGTGGEHPPSLGSNGGGFGGGGGMGLLSPLGGRRARVNSLPSAKTPTVERAAHFGHGHGHGHGHGMHAPADDLRSYEAAVLARKAPTLSLVPRRRGGGSASSASPPPNAHNGNGNQNGNGNAPSGAAHRGNYTLARPSSSSSAGVGESSLAHALAGGAEPGSDRPSFKRLPSTTLGPAIAKRSALEGGGGDVLPTGASLSRRVNGEGKPMVGVPSIPAYAGNEVRGA